MPNEDCCLYLLELVRDLRRAHIDALFRTTVDYRQTAGSSPDRCFSFGIPQRLSANWLLNRQAYAVLESKPTLSVMRRCLIQVGSGIQESVSGMHGDVVDSSQDQKQQSSAPVVTEIVRYLAKRPGIGPGSRVLLCGVPNAELIQGLTDLGLLVTCTDEENVDLLQEMIPEADCCEGNVPRQQFDQSDSGFDLVVVRAAVKADCESVFSRPHMMELASRLACVQPGGVLVQLGGSCLAEDTATTHPRQCCLRQLNMFPGRSSICTFASQSRLKFSRKGGQFAVSLKTPNKRLSPFEWDVLAMNAARRLPTDCCQTSSTISDRDVARAA